jgi:hypothetical protein
MVGENIQGGNATGEVGLEDTPGFLPIALALCLVTQVPHANHDSLQIVACFSKERSQG